MKRLGVSNLAWPAAADAEAMALLAACGVEGMEVAPTRIAPWEELTPERARAFRRDCAAHGLAVSSMQAIFFGKPELALLGDTDAFAAMCAHMRLLAGIADALGASVAVFGAPKSRLRGGLSEADAMALGAERLAMLGEIAATGGLTIGMEPVPSVYGADFLNRAGDVIEIVLRAGHRHVRAHLDTACVTLGGDDPAAAILAAQPYLAHYHVAEPQLALFGSPVCDHRGAGRALTDIGYTRWIVIEALGTELFAAQGLRQAIAFVKDTYF